MECSTKSRQIRSSAILLMIGSLALLCVSHLLAGDLKRVSSVEAMKAITTRVKPTYSLIATQMRLSGSVGVDAVIGVDGNVEATTVVNGNPLLGRMAEDAIKQWKFAPFKAGGKPIKVVSHLTVDFTYK